MSDGFSKHNPDLRLAWDSTSISAVQKCPRYYQYAYLEGYKGDAVDLEFGGYAASAFETYQKARIAGRTRDEATLDALKHVLVASWDTATATPWGGRYEEQWHCTGEEPYRNSKGNRAKCPYSHKGAFFPAPTPSICGECGSAVEESRNYIPNHNTKNRETLARLVVWYCLDQPEALEDGLHSYVFPDGTAAVELSFAIPTPWKTKYGETYILAGHMDQIGVFGEELFVVDQKTTTKGLDKKFFDSYNPSVQFDTYYTVGKLLYPDLPIKGLLIDASQTLVGGAKFARYPYYKTEAQMEEHLKDIGFWIKLAEQYAEDHYWPMNKSACWLCGFKNICNKDPSERERYLKADFKKEPRWDPLKTR